ncbi:gamma-glutamylcyclotransferase [Myxosarcina sp. GI1]|uniref:gamma-glutamylcyclotransferase family protein n=1 Tax=Myxosarcina sp. GI1 TaxID=1541065 RepID=UPI00068D45C7|nr:gamma-glutamylcyclotransferase family protein [Myxosarcina sp. GI1]
MKEQLATMTLKVFVYGTLKPGESNYQYYCAAKVRSRSPAYVRGKLYSLPFGYPAIAEGDNKVTGFLLEFTDFNVLQDLDFLEGYGEDRDLELNEYYRLLVPVYELDSDRLLTNAWCYFMEESKIARFKGIAVASGWWSSE